MNAKIEHLINKFNETRIEQTKDTKKENRNNNYLPKILNRKIIINNL